MPDKISPEQDELEALDALYAEAKALAAKMEASGDPESEDWSADIARIVRLATAYAMKVLNTNERNLPAKKVKAVRSAASDLMKELNKVLKLKDH